MQHEMVHRLFENVEHSDFAIKNSFLYAFLLGKKEFIDEVLLFFWTLLIS